MSSIPSLPNLQTMPCREFRLQKLREHTCTICPATYEKRNSLNRHIKNKHVQKLKCFFCDNKFPADRNVRRTLHMLKQHQYPVPEQFLQGPLDPSLDINPVRNFTRVPPSRSATSDQCYTSVSTPCPDSSPSYDLQSLFPVDEPDLSGIPSIYLPSSPSPTRSSTPLVDERPHFPAKTSETEVGTYSLLFPKGATPAPMMPVVSSLPGSMPVGQTSRVASSPPLPQAIVAPQPPVAPTVSDPETQEAVASILPQLDINHSDDPSWPILSWIPGSPRQKTWRQACHIQQSPSFPLIRRRRTPTLWRKILPFFFFMAPPASGMTLPLVFRRLGGKPCLG